MSTVRAHTELVQGFQAIMATPMGVHVAAAPNEAARAGEAIADCLSWLGEVDRQLTRFSATSDLCQLNADAGQWHAVSQLLFDAVEQSVAAARASDGLFDPTLLTQLEQIGYDRDFAAIERREVAANGQSVPAAPATGSWRDIALDPATQRIRLPLGTRLDLGGIAKGWAADVALERRFAGWAHVLIDAGGDMRARGGPEEGALWALGIGDPRVEVTAQTEPRHAAVLTLGRGGLATSGATTRWWYQGGERRHHLLDPRTGQPADLWIDGTQAQSGDAPLIATVTALAPTAAHAEVAAKVALLRGYPLALQRVEQAWSAGGAADVDPYGDGGVALLLVLGTGEVVCSANLRALAEPPRPARRSGISRGPLPWRRTSC